MFVLPAWLARSVSVPLPPIAVSCPLAFKLAALPASSVSVTGNPRFDVAVTCTGPVANFSGISVPSGAREICCSALVIVRVPVALPV